MILEVLFALKVQLQVPVRQQSGEMEKGRRQRHYNRFIHEEHTEESAHSQGHGQELRPLDFSHVITQLFPSRPPL